ncbi:Cytochrome P450, family 82, subfamily C, polypeptide 4 [Heracleum sosnowskyi]|uniref:Cytochrome P450, family 82, subfamily C, polypeptide 4 n=1 Tax=Heracleum sosnowskyi TaxID=360622 RepID=A0AAD8LXW0_9APIA|nr:Cytochrome P450, family 82, subfamily C, polypeptide 4 [Heracleum sosnowskyi]
MDAVLLLQATASFVALVLFYSLWSSRTNNQGDKKKTQAPKANGAWPILGHLPLLGATGSAYRTLADMADKYGPVFRIQLGLQHALVVSSKEAVMQIFSTNDVNFITRPEALASSAFYALAPYGPFWREMRKVSMFELLSNSRQELLKPVRASEMTTCIRELYSLCCKNGIVGSIKLDIGEWLEQVAINMILQMIARKRFSSIGEGENETESRIFKKAYEDFFVSLRFFEMSKMIPFSEWMDLKRSQRARERNAKEFDFILSSWIDEHKQSTGKQGQLKQDPDFIDVMLSLFAESDGFVSGHKHNSDDVIKATISGIIIAGADAAFATLIWALALLLKHKEMLLRAQQELDIHIGKERWVEESDVKNLIYIQAIIKETLRLYPAAPLSVPREALEDCIVEGYYVPKGTALYVNIWKLHRDSGSWTDPCEFQPARFLTTHAGLDVRSQQFEFIPFSSGRRSCPGMAAGMHIMQLTLARLLQGFDLVTPTDEPIDMTEEAEGITLLKKYPLEVVLTPRLPEKLYQ